MELKEGTKLYRYDLQLPPNIWSIDYRSLEYSETVNNGYNKNHVGFLFFFDNEEVAVNTAKVAYRNRGLDKFYLTSTETLHYLNILDLTGCSNPLLMIQKLYTEGMDILRDTYHLYTDNGNHSLSVLKDIVNYNLCIGINPLERDVETIEKNTLLLQKYLSRSGYPYTILGEILTDFANGIEFKKELIAKGYNGYSFDESVGGHTICLLDSHCLSKPQTSIRDI